MGEPLVVQYVAFGFVRGFFIAGLVLLLLLLLLIRNNYKRAVRGSGLNRVEDLPG